MRYSVLGVGYQLCEHEIERKEWSEYGIEFDFSETVESAVEKLREKPYICIAIRSEQITYEEILSLRNVCPIPTVILPPAYSAEEAHICAHLSIVQYARASGCTETMDLNEDKNIQRILDIPPELREPLTIITVKDLSFCLEHRSVEVRGIEVKLTEKEFDIFALLLGNPKKVFTYEMIMDAVWNEDFSFYSPKAITTHISNLRRKLKTAPDVPEYIKSVRGVGYKFEIPR